MSFDQLPDEVLMRILHLALTSKKPIITSIRAQNIYQAHLDWIEFVTRAPLSQTEINTQLSERPPGRKILISPLLLGTNRRWYRLGSHFFYHTNTFVIIHRELGPFAKQIGFHNSRFIRQIELCIYHKDPEPRPKVSFLNKSYYKKVKSAKVILAKRHKIHRAGLSTAQRNDEWTSVELQMIHMTRKLRNTLKMQERQGAGWAIAEFTGGMVFHSEADHGLWSAMWKLERTSVPSRICKKKDSVPSVEESLLTSKLSDVDVDPSDGSVTGEDKQSRAASERLTGIVIDTCLPTPDTTPEATPEPEDVASEEMIAGEEVNEAAALAIDTELPTPRTTPEPTIRSVKMLALPDWRSTRSMATRS